MTQKDKQLLLQDLSARLPYGVKVWYKYGAWYPEKFATSIRLADEKIALSHKFNKEGDWFPVEEAGEILIKPYLRPISSMTEEEEDEWCGLNIDPLLEAVGKRHTRVEDSMLRAKSQYKPTEWLNAHHFDYHGLIEKNLAIEVTEENNPYKE